MRQAQSEAATSEVEDAMSIVVLETSPTGTPSRDSRRGPAEGRSQVFNPVLGVQKRSESSLLNCYDFLDFVSVASEAFN